MIIGNAKQNLLSKKEEENKYYVNDYKIDLNNDNDSHSIIINNIKNAKRILDVGCGVGYVGKTLKELNEIIVDGIEIEKEARKEANKIYDNVYDFSIEDINCKSYQEFINKNIKYDYIICADIIEHLVNPGLVIYNLSKLLNKNGKLLVSIPNVAHINIISNLIDGNFNYNKTGILDTTHLRFFTKNSFYDFINNINKKYDINLNTKLIGQTFVKEDDNNELLYSVIKDDIYVFQNIFELSFEKTEIIDKKSSNNYNKINEYYLKYLDISNELQNKENDYQNIIKEKDILIDNLNEEISKLKKDNKELENKCRDLNTKLDNIYNSKGYKALLKYYKFKNKFRRKK